MNETTFRLAVGVILMATACSVAYRTGDRLVRRAAVLVALCWVAVTALELATGRRAEPVIAGDVATGVGLLVLVWFNSVPWLWAMIVAQAGLLFLHAYLYRSGAAPTAVEVAVNDAAALLELAVLAGAGLQARTRLQGRRILTQDELTR